MLTYEQSGVNIDEGNRAVSLIKGKIKETYDKNVIGDLGNFSGLYSLKDFMKMEEPVLLAATDGVGTKLKLAQMMDKHNTVGIDLVAMSVNDLICQGAKPLLFLDYIAIGKLVPEHIDQIVAGVANGCKMSGCALIGGETAEMPGMYHGNDYDIAGFCVGVVEKSEIIDGSKVKAGDALIALASSGPHSNGYSLVRKILEVSNTQAESTPLGDKSLADHLLAPTRIYVKSLLSLIESVDIHAVAHITGGGFWENIPRVLPENTQARIESKSWEWPMVFKWLQDAGQVSTHEMYRTFNCGVGLLIAVNPNDVEKTLAHLAECGENAWLIGEVAPQAAGEAQVIIN